MQLQREGSKVIHKRVYRLYKQEGLELRLKTRKKKREALPRAVYPGATASNERWRIDLVSVRLADAMAFRVLSLVDNVSRVSPALDTDFKMTADRVYEVLN
jgi:putative transposase